MNPVRGLAKQRVKSGVANTHTPMYMRQGLADRGIISGNMSGPNLFESGSGMDSRAKPRRQLDIVGENPEMRSYRSG